METSELIKFGILALIVLVIALVARRGQAHEMPKKADHETEEVDAGNGRAQRSAAADGDTHTAGSPATGRERRRRR